MKPVQEVRAGDQVLAQNPVTGEVGYRRVVRTFENVTTSVVSVTAGAPECLPVRQAGRTERHAVGQAGSGEEGGEDAEPPSASQTIRCTPGHPWRMRGTDGVLRWVFAGDLRVGDRLVPEAGPEQVVLALEVREEVARTFNFEVEVWHTYYVAGPQGQPGVLVHNLSAAARAAYRGYLARTPAGRVSRQKWLANYRNARVSHLGKDAATRTMRAHEGRSARFLEESGMTGRLRRQARGRPGDVLEVAPGGRTLDFVGGGVPNAHFAQAMNPANPRGLEAAIRGHWTKGHDITVVTTAGLTPANAGQLRGLFQNLLPHVPAGHQMWLIGH